MVSHSCVDVELDEVLEHCCMQLVQLEHGQFALCAVPWLPDIGCCICTTCICTTAVTAQLPTTDQHAVCVIRTNEHHAVVSSI
jgi:hypothetical protein